MLAIITPIYKNYQILSDFLGSLKSQTREDFKVFMIDNSPQPQSIDAQGLNVATITNTNLGYADAVNRGIGIAISEGFELFLVINPDVVLESDCISRTIATLRKNPNTLIGGKILYAPGYEYHARQQPISLSEYIYPGHYYIWYLGGAYDPAHATVTHNFVDQKDSQQISQTTTTDFVTGCFMAYDINAHRSLGAWNTGYFMYYEDADFCMRARKKNVNIILDPDIVIWHKNAQSTDGSGSDFHARELKKSWLRFALKHAPLRTKLHVIKNYLFS